jgi:SAM-dependent methyltransferase
VDPATVAVYERRAREWIERRGEATDGLGRRFAAHLGPGPIVDLGCGAGRYLAELGPLAVGLDAAAAMLELARRSARPLVRADLAALPFATNSIAGAFARHSYLHLAKDQLHAALCDLHRALRPGGALLLTVIAGTYAGHRLPGDDFEGRYFACWGAEELLGVLASAGFGDADITPIRRAKGDRDLMATARR